MPITPSEALVRCIEHREIFEDEMLSLWRKLMSGELSPVQIAALTMGLRVKKETIGEIVAAAHVLDQAEDASADLVGAVGRSGVIHGGAVRKRDQKRNR